MRNKRFWVVILAFSVIFSAFAEKKYKIVTENYPPYNFMRDGKVTGCCTEIVREILKRLKLDYPIEMTNWNNAYHLALHDPYYIVFSMNKTEARTPMFKWVGPLVKNEWVFYAKADSPIKIKNLEDAKKYRVGSYFNDVCEDFLYDNRFPNLECAEEDKINALKLIEGKIDLWIVADKVAACLLAKQAGVPFEKLKPVYKIMSTEMYIGFNHKTPDALIEKFQKTLDKMKDDGSYQKIIKKYLDLKEGLVSGDYFNYLIENEKEISIKLDRSILAKLQVIADKKGVKVDEIIGEALKKHLEPANAKKTK